MSPSSSPSPERRPPPPRDQPSREQVNQAILGLGRSYVSTPDESTRLLGGYQPTDADLVAHEAYENPSKVRGAVWSVLTILVAVALVILLGAPQILPDALAPLVGECRAS